jgi:signal peptidase I
MFAVLQRHPQKGLLLFTVGITALLLVLRMHYSLCLAKGESMLPGIRSGDLLLVDKRAYRSSAPARGDIVVARYDDGLMIKRVVGLPDEEVELRRGQLYINQLAFAEDYPVQPGLLSLRKGKLFDDRYALLGDNRSIPATLSVHAIVPKDRIMGKVSSPFVSGGARSLAADPHFDETARDARQ